MDYVTEADGSIYDLVLSNSNYIEFTASESWGDGTLTRAWTIDGGIMGTIITKTENASDDYGGYPFELTFKDHSGSIAANANIYCGTTSKTYRTDSTGKVRFVSAASSLTFTWGNWEETSNDDSLIHVESYQNLTTASNSSRSEIYAATKQATSDFISAVNTIDASATPGTYITIGTRQYVIAHVATTQVFVALRYYEESCVWDSGGSSDYAQSDIKDKCTDWYNTAVPQQWKDDNVFSATSVEGVSNVYCFIPSLNHVRDEWSWFDTTANRIFTRANGNGVWYWTSTESSSYQVRNVSDVGGLSDWQDVRESTGFRPAFCLNRAKFKS